MQIDDNGRTVDGTVGLRAGENTQAIKNKMVDLWWRPRSVTVNDCSAEGSSVTSTQRALFCQPESILPVSKEISLPCSSFLAEQPAGAHSHLSQLVQRTESRDRSVDGAGIQPECGARAQTGQCLEDMTHCMRSKHMYPPLLVKGCSPSWLSCGEWKLFPISWPANLGALLPFRGIFSREHLPLSGSK